jgi:drug/metabolite transporter (DMT)-like permease
MKAVPTMAVAIVLVGFRAARGRPMNLSTAVLLGLIGTGITGHLVGNVSFQWSLRVIGLALSVPLCLGTIIISGAILGRFWLGETVTKRTLIAMLVLIVAVPILTLGAEKAGTVEPQPTDLSDAWLVAIGVGAALLSGAAYGWQGAVLRRMATSHTPHAVTLLVLSGTGATLLGSMTLGRIGWEGMTATSPSDFMTMIWAGLFNAGGFFLLTKSLQLITVVHVNAINASQAAMAALAGIAFFHEKLTVWLVSGVVLTVFGLMLIDRRKEAVAIDEV